jgi:phosphatidylserine/phosphatidylglycerophosphate/cardiolipin synthase-like enzyme
VPITIKAYANADDVLIAWQPDQWSDDWVGFELERRDDKTQQVTVIVNRIPPTAGQGPVQQTGISSAQSPIRRCIWTDHAAAATADVSYRVTAMKNAANGGFAPDPTSASQWTAPLVVSGDAGGGLSAYFNRGTLMSQVVSRFVGNNASEDTLRQFVKGLATPGGQARQFLAGDALAQILNFLSDANRRGSSVYAALYEFNDEQLIDALKSFGSRGHVLIGNGSATKSANPPVADQLSAAKLEVRHRDLSHKGASSPSVHNKFIVEADAKGENASRVLTGSTNWTITGLCTQLNNALIVEDAAIAARFRKQWDLLVAAGDDMTPALKASNSQPTTDKNVTLYFAATNGEAEFKPVLDLIAGAKEGALFLMFMPGQSPLLDALLTRAQQNSIYVRGVVSSESSKGKGIASIGGQVIKSGAPAQAFHKDVLLPANVTEQDHPSWAEVEFSVSEIRGAGMIAIVHSKAIVIDPFSENCAVITGSHNFSDSASQHNDENLVIIRGNQKLAQAYALHINGVYDHYSWRSFLASGGDANQIYKPLDGWKPGGSRAQELAFWMNGPIPPQNTSQGGTSTAANTPAAAKPSAKKPKSQASAKTRTATAKPHAKKKQKTRPKTKTATAEPHAKKKQKPHAKRKQKSQRHSKTKTAATKKRPKKKAAAAKRSRRPAASKHKTKRRPHG